MDKWTWGKIGDDVNSIISAYNVAKQGTVERDEYVKDIRSLANALAEVGMDPVPSQRNFIQIAGPIRAFLSRKNRNEVAPITMVNSAEWIVLPAEEAKPSTDTTEKENTTVEDKDKAVPVDQLPAAPTTEKARKGSSRRKTPDILRAAATTPAATATPKGNEPPAEDTEKVEREAIAKAVSDVDEDPEVQQALKEAKDAEEAAKAATEAQAKADLEAEEAQREVLKAERDAEILRKTNEARAKEKEKRLAEANSRREEAERRASEARKATDAKAEQARKTREEAERTRRQSTVVTTNRTARTDQEEAEEPTERVTWGDRVRGWNWGWIAFLLLLLAIVVFLITSGVLADALRARTLDGAPVAGATPTIAVPAPTVAAPTAVVAAPTAALQVAPQAPAVQANPTVALAAVAPTVPNIQIWQNGQFITVPFPQDAVSFAQLVALPCPAGATDCVDLTIAQNAQDYLKPERNDAGQAVAWYLSTERTGQRVFRWTVIRQPWAFPQFGWIRDGTIRTSCGLTSAESNALGYDKMDGASIPGMVASVEVEGFTFYFTQATDLEKLPNNRWTAAQRCPGVLPELR